MIRSYGAYTKAGQYIRKIAPKRWVPVRRTTQTVGVVIASWAWFNKSSLTKCANRGTGVAFTETNGIITSCSPQ